MKEKTVDLYDEMHKFMNLTTRYIRKNKIDYVKNELTHSQSIVLTYIYDNQTEQRKIYQKDIEKNFMIRRSTATEMLKKLEKLGYLERKQSEKDARLKDLILTNKAVSFITCTLKNIENVTNVINKGITEEEKNILKNIILKMKSNILNELKDEINN